ncbi:hypothetical protein E1200_31730, partial [Actinomadura sp. GC306]
MPGEVVSTDAVNDAVRAAGTGPVAESARERDARVADPSGTPAPRRAAQAGAPPGRSAAEAPAEPPPEPSRAPAKKPGAPRRRPATEAPGQAPA